MDPTFLTLVCDNWNRLARSPASHERLEVRSSPGSNKTSAGGFPYQSQPRFHFAWRIRMFNLVNWVRFPGANRPLLVPDYFSQGSYFMFPLFSGPTWRGCPEGHTTSYWSSGGVTRFDITPFNG